MKILANLVIDSILSFVLVLVVFFIIFFFVKFVVIKFGFSSNRLFDLNEYFPKEEIHTLKQVSYLIMMLLSFVIVLYSLFYFDKNYFAFSIIEVLICIYLAIKMGNSLTNKVVIAFLIPFGSIAYLLMILSNFSVPFLNNGFEIITLLDFLHIPACIYVIKFYYNKFRHYTTTNGLGISIILLFSIIFISFISTIIIEGVDPIDSLNMVSNAFTSNGYAILGKSPIGKVNDIILVWAGYILSGVATATLAASILTRHFNNKFDELENLIKENKK